jgi:hypothetical protein
MMAGRSRRWRHGVAAGVAVLMLCAAVLPAAGQQQEQQGGGARRREKPDRARPVTLVVDSLEKRTWTPEELKRLATGKWTNERGVEHPAIPLPALLQDGGVSLDRIKELRIRSRARVVTLTGDDLAKIQGLVLRTGQSFNRPWRLAPLDPAEKGRFDIGEVRRLEVVTTA